MKEHEELINAKAVIVMDRYIGTMYPVSDNHIRCFSRDGLTTLFHDTPTAISWMIARARNKGLIP